MTIKLIASQLIFNIISIIFIFSGLNAKLIIIQTRVVIHFYSYLHLRQHTNCRQVHFKEKLDLFCLYLFALNPYLLR